jgi:hypothetical protein
MGNAKYVGFLSRAGGATKCHHVRALPACPRSDPHFLSTSVRGIGGQRFRGMLADFVRILDSRRQEE